MATDQPIDKADIESLGNVLEHGFGAMDEAAEAIELLCKIVPPGPHMAALFRLVAGLAGTPDTPDYFSHEQTEIEDHEPGNGPTSYYRAGTTQMPPTPNDYEGELDTTLFEFIIPLQNVDRLDADLVERYRQLIADGAEPTAVALGFHDIKQYLPDDPRRNGFSHWVFANYLIDGHHKIAAASLERKPITLLSFIDPQHSYASTQDLLDWYANH